MKLYLFLRNIVWTSVMALIGVIATVIVAFIDPATAVPLGLASIALAVLSPKE